MDGRANEQKRAKETAEAFESYLNWGELNQPKKVVHSVEFAGNLVKVWLLLITHTYRHSVVT